MLWETAKATGSSSSPEAVQFPDKIPLLYTAPAMSAIIDSLSIRAELSILSHKSDPRVWTKPMNRDWKIAQTSFKEPVIIALCDNSRAALTGLR